MSGEEKLNDFLEAVDNWLNCKHLARVDAPDDVGEIINARPEDINIWNSEKCNTSAYRLYAYAEYIECELAKEKNILHWSDSSIWFIISPKLSQYGGQYAKWQEKYFAAVEENPLAKQILVIKNHAEARVRLLEGKSDRIIKMAETLNNLARRK
jgi:hypothetical protein